MDSTILKQSFIGIGNKKEGFSPSDHKREKYELLYLPACVGLLSVPGAGAYSCPGPRLLQGLPQVTSWGNVTTSGDGDCLLPYI